MRGQESQGVEEEGAVEQDEVAPGGLRKSVALG